LAEKGRVGNENLDLAKVKPNLRQSIKWISTIWTEFPANIIVNCWRRSGLLPQQAQGVEAPQARELEQDTRDLQELIDATDLGEDARNAQEYLDLQEDEEVEGPGSVADLALKFVEPPEEDEEPDDEEEDPPAPPAVTMAVIRDATRLVEQFAEENPDEFDEAEHKMISRIAWRLERKLVFSVIQNCGQQSDIRRFFQPNP
jgi:hypothetical protein